MENVIEIVSFKLLSEASESALLEATHESQGFVEQLQGFQYRSLSYNNDTHTWTDVVYWDSMSDALSAGEKFMDSPQCQPLMALIDIETVNIKRQVIKMCKLADRYATPA